MNSIQELSNSHLVWTTKIGKILQNPVKSLLNALNVALCVCLCVRVCVRVSVFCHLCVHVCVYLCVYTHTCMEACMLEYRCPRRPEILYPLEPELETQCIYMTMPDIGAGNQTHVA